MIYESVRPPRTHSRCRSARRRRNVALPLCRPPVGIDRTYSLRHDWRRAALRGDRGLSLLKVDNEFAALGGCACSSSIRASIARVRGTERAIGKLSWPLAAAWQRRSRSSYLNLAISTLKSVEDAVLAILAAEPLMSDPPWVQWTLRRFDVSGTGWFRLGAICMTQCATRSCAPRRQDRRRASAFARPRSRPRVWPT
jgi:hypothetical protein